MTTVDYSTLVQTTLGGVLALGGAFLGQWWVEGRAIAREQRDREHEREVWARVIGYEPHVQFITTLQPPYKSVTEARDGGLRKCPRTLVPDDPSRLGKDTAAHQDSGSGQATIAGRAYSFGSPESPCIVSLPTI